MSKSMEIPTCTTTTNLEISDGRCVYKIGINDKNMHLIIWAPELLEVLERIIANDKAAINHDDYIAAKQAIAKAKGE